MTNRRLFITPEGKIIKSEFNVRWYAIDKNGSGYLYESEPHAFTRCWNSNGGHHIMYANTVDVGDDWKNEKWYLCSNGEWVKMKKNLCVIENVEWHVCGYENDDIRNCKYFSPADLEDEETDCEFYDADMEQCTCVEAIDEAKMTQDHRAGEDMVNRRLFKDKYGKIVKTTFDVYWCTIDKFGSRYLYLSEPIKSKNFWWWSYELRYVDHVVGSFNWEECRWYLKNDGTWVKR